jgi:hypothetical protein
MKSTGEGVFEKFEIINGPFVIKPETSAIKYPIRVVEFYDVKYSNFV